MFARAGVERPVGRHALHRLGSGDKTGANGGRQLAGRLVSSYRGTDGDSASK